MNYYIATFANLKDFTSNCIPISTCHWDPKFFHNNSNDKNSWFIDKNNVLNGIREETLSPELDLNIEDMCKKQCENRGNPNGCKFLRAYEDAIFKVDFNYLLSEFKRVAEDVRKITHFVGEPNIVLLVYEAFDNPCSERHALIKLFKAHNLELKLFNKNAINNIIF